ncbi:MAG: ATP-grasp domain-containing protein [Geobacteraceae bacterium]|nr:ATP-grasp domain-containing protein [Geobacteraceae bacterium]
MFLLDQPYISDFMRQTLKEHQIPVVARPEALAMEPLPGTRLVDPGEAVMRLNGGLNADSGAAPDSPLYTTSENALNWIASNLADTELPAQINLFKDKLKFREGTSTLFPEFFFQRVNYADIDTLDVDKLNFPFIIKPSVGFFSMGVHKVDSASKWDSTRAAIHAEIAQQQAIYPREVLDTATFIIEECIEGDEFAVDAYFDGDSNAVVVGIHQHLFASDHDVSDRVYITSKKIITEYMQEFTSFATAIGKQLGVKNLPVHMELRRHGDSILPIEVNPMRFGGWCTTADSTAKAFGFNPYLDYFTHEGPAWDTILAHKDDTVHSIVVLDNSTGVESDKITEFNYAELKDVFENTLELRRTDYKRYNVFGFLFSATRPDKMAELERILTSDLREFVTCG